MKSRSAEDVFSVSSETDRFWCAREVRRAARDLGFDEEAQWELAIVAAELVSNAVRYAGSGMLTLRAAPGRRPGMEIVVDGYQAKDGGLRANGNNLTLVNDQPKGTTWKYNVIIYNASGGEVSRLDPVIEIVED